MNLTFSFQQFPVLPKKTQVPNFAACNGLKNLMYSCNMQRRQLKLQKRYFLVAVTPLHTKQCSFQPFPPKLWNYGIMPFWYYSQSCLVLNSISKATFQYVSNQSTTTPENPYNYICKQFNMNIIFYVIHQPLLSLLCNYNQRYAATSKSFTLKIESYAMCSPFQPLM